MSAPQPIRPRPNVVPLPQPIHLARRCNAALAVSALALLLALVAVWRVR